MRNSRIAVLLLALGCIGLIPAPGYAQSPHNLVFAR